MNPAIQSIVLLACIAICTTASIKKCQCIRTTKWVKPSLISDVKEYHPRPYCNKLEVIVTLKDMREVCLAPHEKFTVKLLEEIRKQKARNANLRATTVRTTMTPITTTPFTSSSMAAVS